MARTTVRRRSSRTMVAWATDPGSYARSRALQTTTPPPAACVLAETHVHLRAPLRGSGREAKAADRHHRQRTVELKSQQSEGVVRLVGAGRGEGAVLRSNPGRPPLRMGCQTATRRVHPPTSVSRAPGCAHFDIISNEALIGWAWAACPSPVSDLHWASPGSLPPALPCPAGAVRWTQGR